MCCSDSLDSLFMMFQLIFVRYMWFDSELEWDFLWTDVGWLYDTFDHIHLADHQVSTLYPFLVFSSR